MVNIEREDGGKHGRWVIYEDGQPAGEMTYTWAGATKFIIEHTGVEKAFGGKGYGKMLLMAAVEFARSSGVKILPVCAFAKAEFDKNDNLNDVRF